MTTDYKTRVEAGMAWLDSVKPGWERSIDLATLNMASTCDCVLGQTMHDLARVATGISKPHGFLWARHTIARGIDPAALGFDLSDDDSGAVWAALEAEWRTAIKARFDGGVLSDDVGEVRPA